MFDIYFVVRLVFNYFNAYRFKWEKRFYSEFIGFYFLGGKEFSDIKELNEN